MRVTWLVVILKQALRSALLVIRVLSSRLSFMLAEPYLVHSFEHAFPMAFVVFNWYIKSIIGKLPLLADWLISDEVQVLVQLDSWYMAVLVNKRHRCFLFLNQDLLLTAKVSLDLLWQVELSLSLFSILHVYLNLHCSGALRRFNLLWFDFYRHLFKLE